MKKGDLSFLSIGLKYRYNPISGIDSKYLELKSLVKIIEEEKRIQKILDSLVPNEILMIRNSNGTYTEAKFIGVVSLERRIIKIKSTLDQTECVIDAHLFGNSIVRLDDYKQFVI